MRHLEKIAAAFAFALVLIGCASLGMGPDPNSPTKFDTFDSQLHYGYGVYTAVNSAAAASETAGTITRDDAVEVLALTDKARVFLDGASTLEATDEAAAGDKLALGMAVLTQVQAYINARAGVPKK